MMKNSKLSKLLVAGVSVAVLASAVAPMAFAEGEGSEIALVKPSSTHDLRVCIVGNTTYGNFTSLGGSISGSNPKHYVTIYFDKNDDGKYVASINPSDYFEINSTEKFVSIDKWAVDVSESDDDVYDDGDYILDGAVDIDWLAGTFLKTSDGKGTLDIVAKYDEIPNVTVTYNRDDAKTKAESLNAFEGTKAVGYANRFAFDSTIALPTIIANDTADGDPRYVKGWKVTFGKDTGEENIAYSSTLPMKGDSLELSTLVATNGNKIAAGDKVKVKPVFDTVKNFTLEIDSSLDTANGTFNFTINTEDIQLKGVTGATLNDNELLVDLAGKVYYGTPVELPALTTTTKGWTHTGWKTVAKEVPAGKTAADAKYFTFTDTLNPDDISDKEANGTDVNTVTLVPVFTYTGATADVVTYDKKPATPNDTLKKYVNGSYKEDVTAGVEMGFVSGLFFNQVDETFAYYLPINSQGKWVIDTSVTGLKDGVYFADGKQDTEAYGLKKVSGAAEDDKFFYLVSDGLYVDDYTGIWVDEDGSIYNLINGCTSDVPFTGIVEKDGWATSVKDSKVDDKANGFILYGETQYWFINGTCNLNETEAVREHTDGNFYYTVGAKIDFTFNGECNGHTFVNGVASK